jgi:hypothetical protein
MAAVTVFVDDAVLGRLPYLCVKTGAPAEGLLTIHTPVRGQTGLGVWWLLLLAGPLGWVGLLAIAAMSSGGGETLTIQVPWTEAAQHDLDQARRRQRQLYLAGFALIITAVGFGLGTRDAVFAGQVALLLFVVGVGVTLLALLAGTPLRDAQIGVTLDASRRWVTLHRVHSDFAHTVETSRSGRHPAAP